MEAKPTQFTQSQQAVLAIIPKVTGGLSIVGSAWIIYEVLRDRKKLRIVYHRLMLMMSIFVVVSGLSGHFLSTWPIPRGTPGVAFAVGNTATCTAQGFFFQLGLPGATLYQGFLAVYFLMNIRYNWRERKLRRLERTAFIFCLAFGLSTAIAGIPLTLYNNANFYCWIAAFPVGCQSNSTGEMNADVGCTRGMNARIYRYVFHHAWFMLDIAIVSVVMFLFYWTVNRQVQRASVWGGGAALEKKQGMVARLAMFYIITFLLTGLFIISNRIIQSTTGRTYFSLAMLSMTFTPLRGFWNALIYLSPRYANYKKRHPEWSWVRTMKLTIAKPFKATVQSDDDFQVDDANLGDDFDEDDANLGNMESEDVCEMETVPAGKVACENNPDAFLVNS